ncbi:putative methyltransferase-domain-containing protein, partial [Pterulicium gracile]
EPPRPKTPPATTQIFTRGTEHELLFKSHLLDQYTSTQLDPSDLDWKTMEIRLVGTNPLWGHYLWNAAISIASFLDRYPTLYESKTVLELGAGGALPSLVAVKNHAEKVLVTDYPDDPLIDNIERNVRSNIEKEDMHRVAALGYIWGTPVQKLLDVLGTAEESQERGYDLIILSDLIFNHSQHAALLTTCEKTLKNDPTATVIVFYTHHRPRFAERDLGFFELAKERGWDCHEVIRERFDPMFPEDPGAEEVRSTVHGWILKRRAAN